MLLTGFYLTIIPYLIHTHTHTHTHTTIFTKLVLKLGLEFHHDQIYSGDPTDVLKAGSAGCNEHVKAGQDPEGKSLLIFS
jgi:hypothetical protein